jgi:hypothetical protein
MTMIQTIMNEPVAAQWTGPMPGAITARRDADAGSTPDDQASFLREMVRRLDGDETGAESPEDLAGLAARRLVAATFVEPIVREARENSAATGRFAPGVAEQRFGHLMDRSLADAIVSQPGFAGVASLERRLLDRIERQLGMPVASRPEEVRS